MWNELERPHIMEFTRTARENKKKTPVNFQVGKICRHPLCSSPLDVAFARFYSFEFYLQVVFPHIYAFYLSPHAYGCFVCGIRYLDLQNQSVKRINILNVIFVFSVFRL